MKVRMLVGISGGRGDGTLWPHPGQTLEVDDAEGAQLCAGHLAVPVAEDPPAEKAVPPQHDTEARGAVSAAEAPAPAGEAKPHRDDPKGAWVAWAARQGAATADLEKLSKADLVSRYGG